LDYYRNGFGISLKSNSLEFLAPPFVSRQKVENKNDTIVRLRKPRSDFAQLEKQATGKKYNTSLIDL
jgi:hypothetical protein